MRELKFRAWDNYNKIMDKDFIMSSNGYALDTVYGEICGRLVDYKMMQYTGMKDESGIEIYEGDIVNLILPDRPFVIQGNGYMDSDIEEGFTETGEVKLLHSMWFIDSGDEKGLPLDFDKDQSLMVIGNIYENPELLND